MEKNIKDTATVWINRIIAFVSQIGAMFGKTLGFRIGGTMVDGSGANITQLAMQVLGA